MRWWRPKSEHDLDRELRADLELEAEEQEANGLWAPKARAAARRASGNVTWVKEEVRFMWGWTRWEILIQDLRHALRILRKSPGFTATAILTLTLGIGASTAVFTVVDSVMLKPLTYPDSGSLVVAFERVRFLGGGPVGPNPRHVDIWRQRATAFRNMTFFRHMSVGLTLEAEHPRLVGVVACVPNLFEVLQVQPALGRAFICAAISDGFSAQPEDGMKGHDNVAILTYSLWQTLFQGDSNVIGKTIHLDAIPRNVIGVLPASFHFPNRNALRSFSGSGQPVSGAPEPVVFFPVALDLTQFAWNGNYGNWITLGRLNPGVTLSRAEAQLNAIQAQIVQVASQPG